MKRHRRSWIFAGALIATLAIVVGLEYRALYHRAVETFEPPPVHDFPTPTPSPSVMPPLPTAIACYDAFPPEEWPGICLPPQVATDLARMRTLEAPTATLEAEPLGYWALAEHPVPWEINCENEVAWDGYLSPELGEGVCIPGLLSQPSMNRALPANHYGALSSYAEGIMERIEDNRGIARGHGIALMDCNLVGNTAWLRVPGLHNGFQGPFTVADCSNPAHRFFQIAGMGLVAEVGYTTAERWGIRAADRVDVAIGGGRPNGATWQGVRLALWWVDNALEWEDGFGTFGGPRGTPTPAYQ